MNRLFAALAPLALAGCLQAPSGPPPFEPVSTAGQFIDRVAGKPIAFDNGGVLVANPDGTFSGDFGGVAPSGQWSFANGQLCRSVVIGAQSFPEVCNLLEISGDRIRFFNPDGTLSTEAALG